MSKKPEPYIAVTMSDGRATTSAQLTGMYTCHNEMLQHLYATALMQMAKCYENNPIEITVNGQTFTTKITDVEIYA